MLSCSIEERPAISGPKYQELSGIGASSQISFSVNGDSPRVFTDLSSSNFPIYDNGYLELTARNFNPGQLIQLGLVPNSRPSAGTYRLNDFQAAVVGFEDSQFGFNQWYDSNGEIYDLVLILEQFNQEGIIGSCTVSGPDPNQGVLNLEIEFEIYPPASGEALIR